MATFSKYWPFSEALAEGKHNLAVDQLMIALTNIAPTPSHGALADLSGAHILYGNVLTSPIPGRILPARGLNDSKQVGGVYTLILGDITITADPNDIPPFQYIHLYNSAAVGDELIAYIDYGSPLTLLAGEALRVDFDDNDGLLTII